MSNFHAPRDNSSIEMSKDIFPLFRLLLAFFGAIAVLFFLSFASPLSFLENGRGRVEGGTVLSVLYVLSVVFFGFWRWGIPIAHAAIKPNWLSNTWSAVLLISIVAFLLCIAIRPESEKKIRSELTSRINISLNEFPQEKQKHVYALQAVLATGYKNNVIFTGKDFLEIVVDSEVGTWCQPEGGNVVNRILGMNYLSTSTHIRSKYESDKDAATTAANCNRLAKEAAEKFEFAVSVAQHLCAQRNLVDC